MSYSLTTVSSNMSTMPLTLVAWYKFNDATNITLDSSGNSSNLINYGARFDTSNYKTGTGSVALNKNDGEYMMFPSGIDFGRIANENGITFALWAKLQNQGTAWWLMCIGNSSGTDVLLWKNGNSLSIQVGSTSTPINVIDDQWHHIVWSVGRDGKWTIYVDNVNQNIIRTQTIPAVLTGIRTIGLPYNGATDGYAKGNLDDFRIYNRVLTTHEVDVIYNSANINNIVGLNGNVGIGTNTPYGKLHLHNSNLAQDVRLILSDGTTGASATDGFQMIKDNTGLCSLWNYENNDFRLGTSNNEVLRLSNSNVGIGTTFANYKLDVNGTVNATEYRLNGSVFTGGGGGSSLVTTTSASTEIFDPVVWYQFNASDDPITSNYIYDSNIVNSVKYNMAVSSNIVKLEKSAYNVEYNNSLMAWYQFDNGTSNIDSMASTITSSNLTLTNILGETTDFKRGTGCMKFNGNSYLQTNNDNNKFSPYIFSIAFWCKIVQNAAVQPIASCVHFRNSSGNNYYVGWSVNVDNNNLTFVTGPGTAAGLQGSAVSIYNTFAANPAVWRHVAISVNNGTVTLFIDGTYNSQFSRTYANSVLLGGITYTPNNFRIGAGDNYNTPPDNYLKANTLVDDFRFYNKVLSEYEVKQIIGYRVRRIGQSYSDSKYTYKNALVWDGYSYSGDTVVTYDKDYLYYIGDVSNVQLLLNKFHNNNGFTISFIFKATDITKPSQILAIGNSSASGYVFISINIASSKLVFQVGNNQITHSSITNNTYFSVICKCSIGNNNITLTSSLLGVSSVSNTFTNSYNNLFLNVSTAYLYYQIGGTPATTMVLQDFRIFDYAINSTQQTALQTGPDTWNYAGEQISENYQKQRWNDANNYYLPSTSKYITYTDGTVGIGTTKPNTDYLLDVNGNINLGGNVRIGSAISGITSNIDVFDTDLNIKFGNLNRTIANVDVVRRLDPIVWYQFNEDPPSAQLASDSKNLYNLTIYNAKSSSTSGLVASYNFDFTITDDSSGNNRNLTNVNNVSKNTSDYILGGSSAGFNGTNFLYIYNDGTFSPNTFSFCCWCKIVPNGGIQTIATCSTIKVTTVVGSFPNMDTTSTLYTYGWILQVNNNNLEFYTGKGQEVSYTAFYTIGANDNNLQNYIDGANIWNRYSLENSFADSTWKHIALIVSNNSSLKLYINGSLKQNISISYTTLSDNYFVLGANNYYTIIPNGKLAYQTISQINYTNPLTNNSLLDNLQFYNVTLSDDDIDRLNLPLMRITNGTLSSYPFNNGFVWKSIQASASKAYLAYSGSVANIKNLLTNFHNKTEFSIHFVFITLNTSSTSQIFYIGNTSKGDLIRIFIINSTLTFKVGEASAIAAIASNTYYITDMTFQYTVGANIELYIYLNGALSGINKSVSYNNLFANVSTSGLVYYIGMYTDNNNAAPVTLQDFRIFENVLSSSNISALQTGVTSYNDYNTNLTENYGIERWKDSKTYNQVNGSNYIYYTDGTVGIGTNSPSMNYALDVNGSISIGTATNTTSKLSITGLQANTSAATPNGTLVLNHYGGPSLYDKGASVVFTQRWWTGSTDLKAVGMINGIKTNNDSMFGGGLSFWIAPDGQNNMIESMRILSSGRVGIGITSPGATLHVADAGSITVTNVAGFNPSNNAFAPWFSANANPYLSMICESGLWAKGYVMSSSDIRIKKNILDINDNIALQKILSIEPKTYNYIDPYRGTSNVFGFIAQQIREVIPEAVSIQKSIIPNVFQLCDCSLNTVNIVDDRITSNCKLDIIDTVGRKTYTVQDVQTSNIILDNMLNGSNCFVYGTEVDDFHTLDKTYIFTLNVCATQILSRKINDQAIEIIDLKAKYDEQVVEIRNLKEKLAQLETILNSLIQI